MLNYIDINILTNQNKFRKIDYIQLYPIIILLHKGQQLMLKSLEIARVKIRLYNDCLCKIKQ